MWLPWLTLNMRLLEKGSLSKKHKAHTTKLWGLIWWIGFGRASSMHSRSGCSQPWDHCGCATVYDKALTVSNALTSSAIKINRRIKQTHTCLGRDSELQNYGSSFKIQNAIHSGLHVVYKDAVTFKYWRFLLTFGNGRDGAKAGLFSPKRCQGQRYDRSAWDGVAVSCEEHRKTSWKGRKTRRRGNVIGVITSTVETSVLQFQKKGWRWRRRVRG